MSNTYFQLPFDPTAYVTISGAQLAQLVGGLGPLTGFGLITRTVDDAFGNPTIPNPGTNASLVSFTWLRIGNASNASATLYVWNPNAASGVLLQWQIANINSITAGSITGSQIAALTITDNNIFSVGWSKLPSAAAVGGCLTGSMPNPGLANGVVGGANIAQNSITGGATGALALNTVADTNVVANSLTNRVIATTDSTAIKDNQVMSIAQSGGGLNPVGATGKLQVPGASAGKTLKVNTAGTQFELFADLFSNLLETGIGTALQVPQVNLGATGLQWYTPAFTKRSPGAGSTTSGLATLLASNIPPAVVFTFAHGFAALPAFVEVILLCIASDAITGYNGNTIKTKLLTFGTSGASVANSGFAWYADTTNIYVMTFGATSSDTSIWIVPTTGGPAVKPSSGDNFILQVLAYY